jgi:hypothetical protein
MLNRTLWQRALLLLHIRTSFSRRAALARRRSPRLRSRSASSASSQATCARTRAPGPGNCSGSAATGRGDPRSLTVSADQRDTGLPHPGSLTAATFQDTRDPSRARMPEAAGEHVPPGPSPFPTAP